MIFYLIYYNKNNYLLSHAVAEVSVHLVLIAADWFINNPKT